MSKTKFMALEDIKRETRGSAHLFYNPNKACGDTSSCVMWCDPDKLDSFVSEGIIFHRNNGSLQVKEPGIYQVYSKLTLEHNGTSTEKQSNRGSYSTLQKNGKQLTIERFRFPLSGEVNMYHVLHFGIYLLKADDMLFVTMDKETISYMGKNARDSFFGLIGPI